MIDYKLGTDRIIKFLLKEVFFGSEWLFFFFFCVFIYLQSTIITVQNQTDRKKLCYSDQLGNT